MNAADALSPNRQRRLIVIATHGHSGLNAMMTGSVTATLAGRVSRPLLMIKIKP